MQRRPGEGALRCVPVSSGPAGVSSLSETEDGSLVLRLTPKSEHYHAPLDLFDLLPVSAAPHSSLNPPLWDALSLAAAGPGPQTRLVPSSLPLSLSPAQASGSSSAPINPHPGQGGPT